ncbi:NUDIX domain-containing protein [Halobacillus salinarum]|uniref:NUDIX domain-containing protein n=1 Tax=Halobacillus salinarum TaxID=2932257 RepID=A0ABY4EK70_9BACI|nr:NUDIX domain-containing protein [Halobacillus salinarum]UOQ44442.1 NUDIX domain-containing protein [Halobacillus salinarum]
MEEMLTIFDELLKPIGEKERSLVHRDGDWHETFQCWFYEVTKERTELYFQKRASDKKEFPDLFDITAAGHIEAGEKLMEAGLREIKEEIGVKLKPEDLEYTGCYKESLRTRYSFDREICQVHIHRFNDAAPFLIGQEVTDIVKVHLDEFLSLLCKKNSTMKAASVLSGKETSLSVSDLVPHDFYYYQFVIQAIQRSLSTS